MRPGTGKKWRVQRLARSSWICFGIRFGIIRVNRTLPLWIRTISLYLIYLVKRPGTEEDLGNGTERVKMEPQGWSMLIHTYIRIMK